ncbi:MAG: hypothetical protein QM664_04340 [Flavihumibacter sp.]
MQQQWKRMMFGVLAGGLLLAGCKKDKEEPEVNEEEVITTLQVELTPVTGGTTLSYAYRDADGPGGNAPVQDEIKLAPNTAYNVALKVLNESASPAEDITLEIEEEATAHRFYFTPSSGSNISVASLNTDDDGIPVGLSSVWTTGEAASGTINITLRHYPGNPPGKAADDPVNSTKSGTDIEVTFSTSVE